MTPPKDLTTPEELFTLWTEAQHAEILKCTIEHFYLTHKAEIDAMVVRESFPANLPNYRPILPVIKDLHGEDYE